MTHKFNLQTDSTEVTFFKVHISFKDLFIWECISASGEWEYQLRSERHRIATLWDLALSEKRKIRKIRHEHQSKGTEKSYSFTLFGLPKIYVHIYILNSRTYTIALSIMPREHWTRVQCSLHENLVHPSCTDFPDDSKRRKLIWILVWQETVSSSTCCQIMTLSITNCLFLFWIFILELTCDLAKSINEYPRFLVAWGPKVIVWSTTTLLCHYQMDCKY